MARGLRRWAAAALVVKARSMRNAAADGLANRRRKRRGLKEIVHAMVLRYVEEQEALAAREQLTAHAREQLG